MKYKFEYVIIRHPRPLASGARVGKRREIHASINFLANGDLEAVLRIPRMLDPSPKLTPAPSRTVHAKKLSELNEKGVEIRLVKDWKYLLCNHVNN